MTTTKKIKTESEERLNHPLGVKLSDCQFAAICAAAKLAGMTPSAYIRHCAVKMSIVKPQLYERDDIISKLWAPDDADKVRTALRELRSMLKED